MDKGKNLSELRPGDSFTDCVFAAVQVEVKEGANGAYIALTLRDATGQAPARKFQATEEDQRLLLSSQLVCACGRVENNPRYSGQINLSTVRKVSAPLDPSLFLPPSPPGHESHKANFRKLIGKVAEPNLKRLLANVFAEDGEVWVRFCDAVAAGKMHHAYRGGLLEHTLEVAALCYYSCKAIHGLNRDLLITCALLHDIGKLDEMDHGLAAGEYTAAGALVGHVVLGANRIASAADEIPGFPEAAKNAVLHLILSHHGVPEFGAARTPAFSEAYVLAQCDFMSARVYQCEEAKRRAEEGQVTVWMGQDLGRVFVGDLGLEEIAESEPAAPKIAAEFGTKPPLEFNTAIRLRIEGRIAAGDPGKSAEEQDETKLVIPPPGGADYLLQVVGDSMNAKGIIDGDLVFVRERPFGREAYKDGDTVVARIEGEGEMVKTLQYRQESEAWLVPESTNPIHQPRRIDETVMVHGKVVSLLREQ
jgi:3'-5' exoribonuclease